MFALKCYMCDSTTETLDDPDCLDTEDSWPDPMNCPNDLDSCYYMSSKTFKVTHIKLYFTIFTLIGMDGLKMEYLRSCAKKSDEHFNGQINTCTNYTSFGIEYQECLCDIDECNGNIEEWYTTTTTTTSTTTTTTSSSSGSKCSEIFFTVTCTH